MNSSARLALLLGLQLAAGAGLPACDSGEPGSAREQGLDAGTEGGFLRLTPAPLFSAFVEGGAHEALVRVQLKDPSLRGLSARYDSSDESIATVAAHPEDGATITVRKEGVVVIKAVVQDAVGSAKLTITKFSEAQWKAGQARYAKSELAIIPPDGGRVTALATLDPSARNANGACTTCHGADARTLQLETSPTQIAGYSDKELITIFTHGEKPDRGSRSQFPTYLGGMNHSWTVTEEEQQGLIAFMRTLPPKENFTGGIRLCPGEMPPTDGGLPVLCDNDGNVLKLPGSRAPTLQGGIDAGTSTTILDAGVAPAGDAG